MSIDPCPAESTKRSRSNHCGSFGLCFRNRVQSTVATSAIPIGSPGWPLSALSTASMVRPRMVLAAVVSRVARSLAVRSGAGSSICSVVTVVSAMTGGVERERTVRGQGAEGPLCR